VQILHRKAERIKLNGTVIVSGKTMNRKQILNNVGRHQNIVKNKIAMWERKIYDPVAVIGSCAPLPTMIDEGVKDDGGEMVERLPVSAVMWEPAPESAYHSEEGAGGLSVMVLNECTRES
jgi:hypothetical protein